MGSRPCLELVVVRWARTWWAWRMAQSCHEVEQLEGNSQPGSRHYLELVEGGAQLWGFWALQKTYLNLSQVKEVVVVVGMEIFKF
ncbi:UNVERIFIED_CONTAM: hypothetical protein Sradi_5831000 [Sesamum radiatum]|uniref:Secreted protein n=1 Tax=Sesamum radiatum TaxID=300843 RepID=A0AAW2KSS0_SESRA